MYVCGQWEENSLKYVRLRMWVIGLFLLDVCMYECPCVDKLSLNHYTFMRLWMKTINIEFWHKGVLKILFLKMYIKNIFLEKKKEEEYFDSEKKSTFLKFWDFRKQIEIFEIMDIFEIFTFSDKQKQNKKSRRTICAVFRKIWTIKDDKYFHYDLIMRIVHIRSMIWKLLPTKVHFFIFTTFFIFKN